ncbi:hypothetical protein AAFF_G00377240 [Aldrovandia affinis]|uniref:ADP-ribosylation factor-like protein 13B n=1 Tax=Aldrovandia affinis TaxID=143900 RepID=A0AAD7SFX9_9TELE|nr:hypothetical protein AAFF_G00377240 [Aldrovandia affinis]
MFNLMSSWCGWISQYQQPIREVTVSIVGLDNAGKTSAVRGMLKVPLEEEECVKTEGCVHTELRVDNFLVTVLDVGGASADRGVWRDHYGKAHGIIFVVDSSDRTRSGEAKEFLVDLLKEPRVAGKPLLVLANKQDKMNAMLGSELIEVLSLERLTSQSQNQSVTTETDRGVNANGYERGGSGIGMVVYSAPRKEVGKMENQKNWLHFPAQSHESSLRSHALLCRMHADGQTGRHCRACAGC